MDNQSTRRRRLTGTLCAVVVLAGFGMASSAQAASTGTSNQSATIGSKIDPGVAPCAWRTN